MTTSPKAEQSKAARSSAIIIGVAGGIALGMWVASALSLMDRDISRPAPAAIGVTAEPVVAPVAEEPPAVKTPPVVTRAASRPAVTSPVEKTEAADASKVERTARVDASKVEKTETAEAPKLVMTVPVTAPELHNRIKPVLARGTKINLAVEGFSDAELFATIAHAARNTQVPFILLKHRVLTERQSLSDAIRASKPDLDAEAEAARARSAAKAVLAALNTSAN